MPQNDDDIMHKTLYFNANKLFTKLYFKQKCLV